MYNDLTHALRTLWYVLVLYIVIFQCYGLKHKSYEEYKKNQPSNPMLINIFSLMALWMGNMIIDMTVNIIKALS